MVQVEQIAAGVNALLALMCFQSTSIHARVDLGGAAS
jgi:hypothetical protein